MPDKKQSSDHMNASLRWDPNKNTLHTIPKIKGTESGVGQRPKSTKND